MAAQAKNIDWELLEADWRAGIKSIQQIVDDYNACHAVTITSAGLRKRMGKLGIPRDLSVKIQARADAILTGQGFGDGSGKVPVETIIQSNAEQMASVRLEHRADIRRGRSLVSKLMTELEETTDNRELFSKLGELMENAADAGNSDKLNEIYRKVISMPSRTSAVKQLADALKTVITMEREAFGMDKVVDNSASHPFAIIERVIVDVGHSAAD